MQQSLLGIQLENKKIEDSIKEIARDLLKQKIVDVIIGYSKGTVPLNTMPIFIRNEEEIKKVHSYDCPCILSLDIKDGNKEYLDWLKKESK